MAPHLHVVGARPNFMKAAPVIQALSEQGNAPILIHTGQHYDRALSSVFFDQLGIPEPDENLNVGSGSHAAQTAALLLALEETLLKHRPTRVVVYGDINSTLAATLVACKLDIPVAHVEAGLRSFDRSMPEEVNRVVTDALADLHFTTSPEARQLLESEGIADEGIHFVGNPMIDTLLRFRDVLKDNPMRTTLGLPERYGVATLHRPSNVDHPETAERLVEGLAAVARMLPIVIPLHPRGREALSRAGLDDVPAVTIVEPLGYLDFMALLSRAAVVLTDSGGIQEESTVLGIPCLTLRDNTERPITVTMGTNRLVGTDPVRIHDAAIEVLDQPLSYEVPPLWDGDAGVRIAEILIEH